MPFYKGQLNHPSRGRFNKVKAKKSRLSRPNAPFSPGRRKALTNAVKQGMSVKTAAAVSGIAKSTAYNWISDESQIAPKGKAGRKRKVNEENMAIIQRIAQKQPFSSIKEIVEMFEEKTGVSVHPRTMQLILYERMKPNFVLKKPDYSTEEANLSRIYDMQLAYCEGLRYALNTGKINIEQLFFQDEFPVSLKKLPTRVRCQKGTKFYTRKPYRYTTLTASLVIGVNGVMRAQLYDRTMNDATFKQFCLEIEERETGCENLGGPPLFELLPPNSYLIWDRLGRSGRSKDPKKIHFNPDIIAKMQDHKIKVIFLPPKGHLMNPQELLNSYLQDQISKWKPSSVRTDEYGRKLTSPATFSEAKYALSSAIEKTKGSDMFRGFYRKRMLDSDLQSRLIGSKVAKEVFEERSEVAIVHHWPDIEE